MTLAERLRNKIVLVSGRNAAIAATEEDVADWSGATTGVWAFAAATLLEIASSSAADVLTSGTGAWTIRLHGLDANYAYQTEDVNLNGQTVVTTTKLWLRVWGAEVIAAGTGGKNAGNINIADDAEAWTAGVPQTATYWACQIPIGANVSHSGFWTVPAGEHYRLEWLCIGNRAQVCSYSLYTKPYGGLWYAWDPYELANPGNVYQDFTLRQDHPLQGPMILSPKEDFCIRATAAVAGAVGTVQACLRRLTV